MTFSFRSLLLEMLPESLNNSDERGRRPIHYAAAASSTEPLQMLFKRKDLNVDEVDKNGITPLMITAQLGRVNNTTVLLERAKKSSALSHKLLVNREVIIFLQNTSKNNFKPKIVFVMSNVSISIMMPE